MYGLMADLHLHAWSAFATDNPSGVNSRLQGLLDEIKRCAKELSDAGGSALVMAGDVFHVRGSVNPIVLNALIDTLAECNRLYGTQFVIIPGNHDLAGKESTRLSSAVTALGCGYVIVTADPYELVPADTGLEGSAMLVPWVEDIEVLKAKIIALRTEITDAGGDPGRYDLILHAPIDGVIEGLPVHGLTPEWLAQQGFKRVFAGHYHNHKVFELPMTDCKVYSIGALAHHSWSDIKSRAGFLLVDEKAVNWRKSHLPQFVDLGQLASLDPEEVPLVVDGNFIRVRVEASEAKEVEAARKELMDMGARAVLVQAEPPAAPTREGAVAATVAAGASLEVSVSDFVKSMKEFADAARQAAVAKASMDVLASVSAEGD